MTGERNGGWGLLGERAVVVGNRNWDGGDFGRGDRLVRSGRRGVERRQLMAQR